MSDSLPEHVEPQERRSEWLDWQDWRIQISGELKDARETMASLTARVSSLEGQATSMQEGLKENTALTAQVVENTKDLVEWTKATVGAFKVLEMLATFGKWVGGIAAALVAIYTAWTTFFGGKP